MTMIYYTRSQEIKDRACQAIQELNGVWKVILSQPLRTMPQNDFLHTLLAEIAPHTPFSPAALKDVLKAEFIGMKMVRWRGKEYPIAAKTSELTKEECTLFIEKLLALADELQIQLKGGDWYGIQPYKKHVAK